MNQQSPLRRKRVLWVAAAAVVVTVAAILLVPGNLARDLVVRQLSERLGRPVTVQSVKTTLLPRPRVRLIGLAVPESAGSMLSSLTLDELDLSLAFGPLLRRELAVTGVTLTRPRIVLRAAPAAPADGRSAPAAAPNRSALRIAVRRLSVVDGAVRILRADGGTMLELAGLQEDLAATLMPTGDLTLAGETRVDTLRIHLAQGVLGEGLALRWRKDLAYEAGPKALRVAESSVQLGDLAVGITGTVDALGTARPLADLLFEGGPVQVSSLAGFLPSWLAPQLAGTTSSGEVALAGFLRGPLGPPPAPGAALPFAYDVRFDLANGRLSAPSLPAPLSGIEVHLRAHDDVVELTRFAAATPRSKLDVSGTMSSLLTTPVVDLKVIADLDLAEAMALQPPRTGQPELSGRFSGAIDVSGPVRPPTGLSLVGEGRLHDVKMSGPDLRPAIDRIDGPIRLQGQRLLADGVIYRQGTTDLTVSGSVDNYLALVPELKVAPPAVLAAKIDGRLLDADTYAAPRGVKKEAAGPNSGLARMTLLTGRADVTMRRLLTRGHELQDVQGVVDLDRGRLVLRDVHGTLYGGRADLAGTVDLSDPAHGTMDLDVRLAGVQAQELGRRAVAMSRFARLGGLVTGLVDGQAKLKGALDDTFGLDLMTFTTNGQVEFRQARLAGSPLQKKLAALLAAPQLESVAVTEWLQPFRIEGGKLHVDGLKMTAAGIGVRAGGWQALDGTVALGVELTVPQALAEGLRSKLPAPIAAVLFDGSGTPLVVPVGMTGRWDDPTVQLDTEAMVGAAGDRAQARITDKVDEARQQVTDRITDQAQQALDGLLGQKPDSTVADSAAAGADSTQAPELQDQVKSILKGLRGGKGK